MQMHVETRRINGGEYWMTTLYVIELIHRHRKIATLTFWYDRFCTIVVYWLWKWIISATLNSNPMTRNGATWEKCRVLAVVRSWKPKIPPQNTNIGGRNRAYGFKEVIPVGHLTVLYICYHHYKGPSAYCSKCNVSWAVWYICTSYPLILIAFVILLRCVFLSRCLSLQYKCVILSPLYPLFSISMLYWIHYIHSPV